MNNNIRSELIDIFEDVSSKAYTLPCKDSPCPFLESPVTCEECWSIGEICTLFERKQTELTKEIFEEIEKLIEPNDKWLWQWDLNKLTELKKKYTGEPK